MYFQDQLYRLRKERGISQEEMANVVGVSRQAVQKWEAGTSRPDMDNLTALADYFGVTLDHLVRGGEAPSAEAAPRTAWDFPYFEYRSRAALFGLPLVHVKLGYGVCRARGIVAVGNVATGVVALGGLSAGLLSLGGVSVGALALGGMALGGVALGGLAIGLAALGGGAVGILAIGGMAVGRYAAGGVAYGAVMAVGDQAVSAGLALSRDALPPGLSLDQMTAMALERLPDAPLWLVRLLLRLRG